MNRIKSKRWNGRSGQVGLTLVELLVALVIGMAVMAGVVQLFISNKETYRTQDGLARLQETGRFTAFLVNKDLRGAGNLGCGHPGLMEFQVVAASTPDEVNLQDADYLNVFGHNNVTTTLTLPSGTEITPNAGTDVVNVRGISPITGIRLLDGAMASTEAAIGITQPDAGKAGSHYLGIAEGDLLLISDCEKGDIFRASNTPSDSLQHNLTGTDDAVHNVRLGLGKAYGEDAVLTKLRSNWYYIKDSTKSLDGQIIPELRRVDMAGNDTALIGGVENMQVVYGVDQDSNLVADRYVTANNVTDWNQVLNVKVYLLINSASRVTRTATDYYYRPSGDDAITPDDPNDKRLKREFSFVTTVRNHTL